MELYSMSRLDLDLSLRGAGESCTNPLRHVAEIALDADYEYYLLYSSSVVCHAARDIIH